MGGTVAAESPGLAGDFLASRGQGVDSLVSANPSLSRKLQLASVKATLPAFGRVRLRLMFSKVHCLPLR